MYNSIEAIRAANEASGGHWFSPSTIAFFSSTVEPKVYGGNVFVSREASGPDGAVFYYTVRECDEHGNIHTVAGGFQAYGTAPEAHTAAREYVAARERVAA